MREWLRTGKLKGLKAGRLWRARTRDLERFFEEFAERLMAVPWVVERRLQGRVHEW
jgi:hypothetical protein